MYEIFADLHVHIGRSEKNKPIKITAARSLNFANITKECAAKVFGKRLFFHEPSWKRIEDYFQYLLLQYYCLLF